MTARKSFTSYHVGDIVTWSSQAGGHAKKKTGTVVEVVPAFKIPRDKNFGSSRNHESYIVAVTYEPKRSTSAIKSVRVKKPERYWPIVSNLHLVRHAAPTNIVSKGIGLPPVLRPLDDGEVPPMEDLKTNPGSGGEVLPFQDVQWSDNADAESVN